MSNQYKFDETTGKWLASGAILSGVNSVNGLAGDVTYLPAGIVTTTTGDVSPAVYAKIYTGDTPPAVPNAGDVWIDSSYGSGTSNILRWRKIAGGGETSLSGTDANGLALVYTPGYEELYINGILQYRGSDYVATTGTTITGITALAVSDTIEVVAPSALQIGDYYTQAQSDARYANNTGFRNKLINGDMRVNQRGAYGTTTNTFQYTTDRWWVFSGTSTVGAPSYVSSTGLTGFPFALRAQRQAANTGTAAVAVGQTIESTNVYALQGQTVTVSFWARAGADYSSTAKTLSVVINQGTGVDQGTLATINQTWTNQANTNLGTAILTTSWQKFNYSYLVPVTATELALLFLYTAAGTAGANDYFDITGVQLEIGSTVTPFETRPYGTELALCQRYCYRIAGPAGNPHFAIGSAASTAIVYTPVRFPTTMRGVQSSTTITSSAVAVSDFTAANTGGTITTNPLWNTPESCLIQYNSSGLTTYRPYAITFTANTGYLQFDSEL